MPSLFDDPDFEKSMWPKEQHLTWLTHQLESTLNSRPALHSLDNDRLVWRILQFKMLTSLPEPQWILQDIVPTLGCRGATRLQHYLIRV